MGTLLQFAARRRSTAASPPPDRGPADILIFTGVRYERAELPGAGRAEPAAPPDRRVQPS